MAPHRPTQAPRSWRRRPTQAPRRRTAYPRLAWTCRPTAGRLRIDAEASSNAARAMMGRPAVRRGPTDAGSARAGRRLVSRCKPPAGWFRTAATTSCSAARALSCIRASPRMVLRTASACRSPASTCRHPAARCRTGAGPCSIAAVARRDRPAGPRGRTFVEPDRALRRAVSINRPLAAQSRTAAARCCSAVSASCPRSAVAPERRVHAAARRARARKRVWSAEHWTTCAASSSIAESAQRESAPRTRAGAWAPARRGKSAAQAARPRSAMPRGTGRTERTARLVAQMVSALPARAAWGSRRSAARTSTRIAARPASYRAAPSIAGRRRTLSPRQR